jgi:hypothetical protein
MTKQAVNRVKDVVAGVTAQIEKAADETATELTKVGGAVLDNFHKVKVALTNPLKEANAMLEDLLHGDNGPEDGVNQPEAARPTEPEPPAS